MDTTATSGGNIDIPADIGATLVDPAAYADHRIHDSYRWLRANNPLGIARPEGFDPFWVVTKHAHIQAVSRQNELFHNADRPTTLTNRAVEERVRKITGGPNLVRSLVQMDAPDHPKYRLVESDTPTHRVSGTEQLLRQVHIDHRQVRRSACEPDVRCRP